MSAEEERLSQDLIFDVLSSARRRYVLYYLREHGGRAEVTELASQIAAWEYDRDVEELTSQQEKRVYVSLYQTHIPKLADIGIVDYDQDAGVVELTDRAEDVEVFFSPDADQEQPWQLYYLGLAALSGLVLSLIVLGVPPLGALDARLVALVVVVAFGALALAHYVVGMRQEDRSPDELEELHD